MSHGPNRYKAERRRTETAAERAGPDAPAVTRAQHIIAVWNAGARRDKPAEFFPTFDTALTAGCWHLTYCCPACRQMATIDIRGLANAHHPRAPISMLIPKLSCDRCCPNPPLAALIELETPTAELPLSGVVAPAIKAAPAVPAPDRAFVRSTMGDLIRNDPRWLWLHCENVDCRHKRAVAVVPYVIRWGPNAPSDKLRRSMRCTSCGHKGATTHHPAWADANSRWQPFPTGSGDT